MSSWDDGSKGFYDKNGKWWNSEWDRQEAERIQLERRAKVNGLTHAPDRWCECGAKHDREFPQIHSDWCRVYIGNK